MRILSINTEPIAEFSFLNAGRGPGAFYEDRVPVLDATVDRLPEGLSAFIATADLQGRERFQDSAGRPLRLVGEVLPQWLVSEVLSSRHDLLPGRIGVLLGGDFYAVPALDRRGGLGDVTPVWTAFAEAFRWVVGVAGNHDAFGAATTVPARLPRGAHCLDGGLVELDGLKIAGLSGIIGNPRRPWRRDEPEYLERLRSILSQPVDLLVTHDGPEVLLPGCRGSSRVRQLLETAAPCVVVRGHAHWEAPLAELANGIQVLNVDARVVILRQGPPA